MARQGAHRKQAKFYLPGMVLAFGAGVAVYAARPQAGMLVAPGVYFVLAALALKWIVAVNAPLADPPRRRQCPSSDAGAQHGPLSAAEILGWEFEYARTTASEAMSDRQALVNYYLAIAGALPTAVVLVVLQGPGLDRLPEYRHLGVWALWLMVVIGWIFFLKMVQLRSAWFRSVAAMNAIKEFYLQHVDGFRPDELAQAFLWRADSLPRPDRPWNVFFLSAMLIGFLNTISFGLGGLLLNISAPGPYRWGVLPILSALMLALHVHGYSALLRKPESKRGGTTTMVTGEKVLGPPNRRVEILEQVREYDGYFKVDHVRLRFERFDGTLSPPLSRWVVDRGDAVCVLLYDAARDMVLLIQQFRYPAYIRNGPGWLWEIVAGMQDRGRDRVTVAHAELLEEAGYQVDKLVPLMSFYPSPGGLAERLYLYLGYFDSGNKVAAGGGLPSENEDIRLGLFPLADALRMVETGEICDAKTIIALQWLALHRNNLPRLPK